MTETIKMSPYFPRGSGPLVSILLPTRGRTQGLLTAVDSLYSLATNKSNIEFIFKVDDDDKETKSVINKISSLIPNCKVIVSPRGRGYLDLHVWVNQMCSIATGDWLFLMNDDARMTTQDWDGILEKTSGGRVWPGMTEICLLSIGEEDVSNSMAFFLLRRKTYELLGHFSLSPLCDGWLYRVMVCCGCGGQISRILMKHTQIDDQLGKENSEARDLAYRATFSHKQIKLRVEDATKIANRIGWFESKRKWSASPPEQEGWFLWKRHLNDIPIDMYLIDKDTILTYREGGLQEMNKPNIINGLWAIKD